MKQTFKFTKNSLLSNQIWLSDEGLSTIRMEKAIVNIPKSILSHARSGNGNRCHISLVSSFLVLEGWSSSKSSCLFRLLIEAITNRLSGHSIIICNKIR